MGASLPTLQIPDVPLPLYDDALLCSETVEAYEEASRHAVSFVAERFATTSAPTTGPTPQQMAAKINHVDLHSPLGSTEQSFNELTALYLDDAVYFHDTKYAAHLNCPVAIPAVVTENFVTSINTSMDTFDQSAGATLIERKLVSFTAELIGYDPSTADGIFTSGGTQSNLQAMLIARNTATARLEGSLPERLAKLRIYCSEDAHFSIRNAAMLLGLGYEAAVAIPTDAQHRMDAQALRDQLAEDLDAGLIPMAISATSGTTDFGAIDPLAELRQIATEAGAWLHVDAAYGCGLLVSSRHRHRLSGIEQADSVTVDYHKSFFQPIGSSALIVRSEASFESIAHYAEYLNPAAEAAATPNQVSKSLQTTRRFDALKLWVTLRTLGASRLGEMFDQVIALAEDAQQELAMRSQLHLVADVQLSTLVFSFEDPQHRLDLAEHNALANQIRQRLYASGEAMIAATTVAGKRLLKLTLLNPNTTLADISEILDAICRIGTEILAERTTGDN
ncbi:aspartate aminotransferase family protein [Glutamicibacter sp. JL.03c]|uniref:pyridoxal phosphate-dependent decarboxylase family protein n=1 Tax=Glutamicibacter sp. JL.03c TaxID=2984842 RepID=UPI0021F6C150|nr:aspartate aminotransferase family protein [Glutamicibacter sp. JL.03c]UYQ78420.1 aspartate aminotransferase family protein [Glutamicibacter sp. JL.03c]